MFKKTLLILFLWGSLAFCEDKNIISSVVENKPKMTFLDSVVEFNKMGGIFIYSLYLLSIISLAYILERFFFYNFSKKII